MFDPKSAPPAPSSTSTAAAEDGSPPTRRAMKIGPLDLRQQRFRIAFRGFDKTDVVAFLTEAADDYEQAVREIDRLRQDLSRVEALLADHREREANLRNTLLTAQRLSDEMKEAAQTEAKLVVREAQGRSDTILHKAEARRQELERDINELLLRRRDVERSVEASIQSLQHALQFVRERERPQGNAHVERPPHTDGTAG